MPLPASLCAGFADEFCLRRPLFSRLFPRIEENVILGKASLKTTFVFFQKQLAEPEAERQDEVTLPVGLPSEAFSVVKTQNWLLDQQRGMCSL